jgi:hypothetical protein
LRFNYTDGGAAASIVYPVKAYVPLALDRLKTNHSPVATVRQTGGPGVKKVTSSDYRVTFFVRSQNISVWAHGFA